MELMGENDWSKKPTDTRTEVKGLGTGSSQERPELKIGSINVVLDAAALLVITWAV